MINYVRIITVCSLLLVLSACEPDNEHFCARYHYVYGQLLDDGLPSYNEMKQQLIDNQSNPKKDKEQAKFMLFVLEDWHSEAKRADESAREFCMRRSRWQNYQ